MIYRYDFRYTLAKLTVSIPLRLNFRRMIFVGKKENVSKDRAVILAPNHRNALLDALLLVFSSYHRKQIVFLARADIFKQKFVAWLLKGMRIMPVFRIRDGKDNLDKNSEIFDNAARILRKNNPIALFPEARHNPKQSLLPIQKAVPRIVLPTEASVDFQLQSQIIPISIYYRDMFGFLSDAYVTFGAPIEVSDYRDVYIENPVLAVNQLRQELENRLKSMVVNIWNDDFYNEYIYAIDWNGDRIAHEKYPKRKDNFLQAALYIVRKLDELYENDRDEFDRKTDGFREAHTLLKKYGLNSKDRIEKIPSASNLFVRYAALILSGPVAFFGLLNGIFPILLNKKLTGIFKDKQFIPSVRYASGLLFVPIFDLIQSLTIGAITKERILALGYFILMPITFYFALYWRKWLKTARRDSKVRRFKKQHPDTWKRLLELIRL
ncbi:1-acyl-sn-glycerol-3-phosphate acyltransferase [Proteiniphilum sp. UBA5384]|mgnify:CR=1 FL=1|uniref:1-acyl-sn-glycerol-3-phosphate acyltransferase n=1 Tax=Proteiniphilum sp. UBA5384 TaxID=1947279 RepID=UPI0025E9723C|nr:1-acyl-sn-glycerol-3-phosphate acyltransferase [Proteiniphilum sp. UBA5384]